MPKIRGFKADLWTDEDFVELSPYARLLWMGMWNYACDNGHLDDKSKQIKMRVLPTDDVNCAELLRELEAHTRITRANGVITIPNFAHHQRPDKRYFQTCDAPGCTKPGEDSQPETRGGHASALGSAVGPHVDGEMRGVDGDGDMRAAGKPRKTTPSRGSRLPDDWQPSEAHYRLAVERSVNLAEEADKFRDWCAANGTTKKDWEATFRNWIRNARPTPGNVTPIRPDADGRTALPPLPPKGFFDR